MKKPLISIIVITYNIEGYVAKCIESIKKQPSKEIEIIIIDNNSGDGTLKIINEKSKDDNRIKVLSNKENKGPMYARLQGMGIARGEYLLFVDGDDYIELDSIMTLSEIAEVKKYDLILFNYMIEDQYGNKVTPWDSNFYKMNNKKIMSEYTYLEHLLNADINFSIWTKLIKKSFLDKLDNLESISEFFYAEDLAISYLIAINKPTVYLLDRNIYYYVQRKSSLMHKISDRILDISKSINFIKVELESNNLLQRYKEEFDYLIYKHMYFYRKQEIYKNMVLGKKMFKQWKKFNVKIYKNKYYKKLYNRETLKQKVLNHIILRFYFLGFLYYKIKDKR